ncbi:MAG: PulJ/GspJ family protein, partial [Hyphomicrobium sp.]
MSMNVGPHRESGFTLLETLVSVMLLALAVAFLPGLLSLGTRSMQARTAMDAQSAEAPAQQFLEQRLAGAVAAVRRGDDGRLMPAFAGRRDELTFVAPAARSAALVGMLD